MYIRNSMGPSTVPWGMQRKWKFHQSRGNLGTETEWGTRSQRTISHKKINKNIEQQHRPLQKWVNSGASERLAVPASCKTPAMLFIVNDIYIEYSDFHTNGFNQEDTHVCFTHYNFAQYFQDIYWTQPIKTSSFWGKTNFASSFS